MSALRVPVATLWVCVDCLFAAEGEAPEAPDCVPWNLLPDDEVTHGLLFGEDGCEHTSEAWHSDWRVAEEHSEHCERETFSWRPCDACGSSLGGEREAYTLWGRSDAT